ncbi:unnamed protein product [Kuraishia capsulata CBS 1993]|uniref:Uncharacterized protein n=1 Tax=Kuraishia capsulata CBS 1993 TaxID=1382522 RepID=W6MM10_9ASCO|nr:uncharacterized protein KUCA_T00003196001 [Kuraishia capsulata CBS 1993]CDK27218.1 unnamed protein product [Kuraishia capsulata CBS 1993]
MTDCVSPSPSSPLTVLTIFCYLLHKDYKAWMSYYNYEYGSGNAFVGLKNSMATPTQSPPYNATQSPATSSTSSSYPSSRARFMSSKGFEFEDDVEFCPDIPEKVFAHSQQHQQHSQQHSNQGSSSDSSPRVAKVGSPSPKFATPRVKKALDIVNPATGMRVGSPSLK